MKMIIMKDLNRGTEDHPGMTMMIIMMKIIMNLQGDNNSNKDKEDNSMIMKMKIIRDRVIIGDSSSSSSQDIRTRRIIMNNQGGDNLIEEIGEIKEAIGIRKEIIRKEIIRIGNKNRRLQGGQEEIEDIEFTNNKKQFINKIINFYFFLGVFKYFLSYFLNNFVIFIP